MQGIYVHRYKNKILYVGQSTNIKKRANEHYNKLLKNKHVNIHLQRIFNKNPNIELGIPIEDVKNRDDLTKREIYWIKQLKPSCNISLPDKKDKWQVSEETRQKISDTFKKRKIRYKRTKEDRQKISERRKKYTKGHPMSQEQRDRISKSVSKLWEDDEYRLRMSKSHMGKTTSPNQKEAARKHNHIRWHVNRGIKSEKCKYCNGEINEEI